MKKQEHMNPDDKIVVFKLNDMMYPIAGRITKDNKCVYIHREDGLILTQYTFGFRILKIIENIKYNKKDIENF